jgi:hypothetical protein
VAGREQAARVEKKICVRVCVGAMTSRHDDVNVCLCIVTDMTYRHTTIAHATWIPTATPAAFQSVTSRLSHVLRLCLHTRFRRAK